MIYCVADGDKDRLSPVCSQDFLVLIPRLCGHLEFLLQAFLMLLNRKVKCRLRLNWHTCKMNVQQLSGRFSSKPGQAVQTSKRTRKAEIAIPTNAGKENTNGWNTFCILGVFEVASFCFDSFDSSAHTWHSLNQLHYEPGTVLI